METLTKLFEARLGAFLERTGLRPSTFGLQATGNPNLIRQLRQVRSVEVVAIVRTDEELGRAEAVLDGWAKPSGPARPDAEIREEVARIERAILQGAVAVLEECGGLQAAMKRSVTLEKQVRRQPAPGLMRCASTWRTMRLAGVRYQ